MGRAFAKILILVIIIILVGGGFFAWQYFRALKEATEVDTPDSTLSELEGWQTYRNEELGFEVKYPMDWTTAPAKTFRYFYPQKYEIPSVVFFTIAIAAANPVSPFKAFDERSEDLQETFIGERKFYWKEYKSDPISKIIDYYSLNNDGFKIAHFSFSVIKENQYSSLQEIEIIFNQMLSTFRFVE